MVDSTGARLSEQAEDLVGNSDSIPASELEGESGNEPEDEPEDAPEREDSINNQSANSASTPAGPSQQSRERYEFTEPERRRIIKYAETQNIYGRYSVKGLKHDHSMLSVISFIGRALFQSNARFLL